MRLSAEEVHLACGEYQCSIAPTAGGRLTTLSWKSDGSTYNLIIPLATREFEDHHWPKAGAFPMAPFSNRLPNAGFVYQSRWRSLVPGPGGNFAQHGISHRRAWSLVERSDTCALIEYIHKQGDDGWEWPFSISQLVEISDGGLSITFTLINLAGEPMPVSIGWHPYHPIHKTGGEITIAAALRVPLDQEGRASAASGPAPTLDPSDNVFEVLKGETIAFSGWNQKAAIPVSEEVEAIVSVQGWRNLVVHRPKDAAYACIEPAQLLPGTLGDLALQETGVGVLDPGASTSARWLCKASRR
jgi:aldose 1-epimerase